MSKKKEAKYSNAREDHGWESGFEIIKTVTVVIPFELGKACMSIANQVDGNEFSIITDIEKIENNKIYLKDTFYIPDQKVTSGSIHYGRNDRAGEVVIHRHPDGCNQFSQVDEDYINQNFAISILYTQVKGFVYGIYNAKLADNIDGAVRMPINIEVDFELPEVDITPITIEKPVYVQPTVPARTSSYGESAYKEKKDKSWGSDVNSPQVQEKYYYDYEHADSIASEDKVHEKTQPTGAEVNDAIVNDVNVNVK